MATDLKYTFHLIVLVMVVYNNVIQCRDRYPGGFEQYIAAMGGRIPAKPRKCYGSDDILDEKCCIIPPFFSKEIAEKCGTKGAFRMKIPEQNVTGFARIGLSCQSWTCILDQYHLLIKERVDDKRFNTHLQRWVKLNPEFKEVVSRAKEICRQSYFLRFPLDPCKFQDYQHCYRNYLKLDCPVSVNSTLCDLQKKFYEECREYFVKK